MLKKLVVFLNFGGNLVCAPADIFLVKLGIGGLGIEEDLGYLEMKQLLFNFGVHQNLVRNISFQKSLVDVSVKPFLAQQLVNQTEGNDVLALELLTRTNAALVVILET